MLRYTSKQLSIDMIPNLRKKSTRFKEIPHSANQNAQLLSIFGKNTMQVPLLNKFCDGYAIFALAVHTQAKLLDELILPQGLLHGTA